MPTTTIERTCPACNGTGGEGGKKTVSLSDFVSGGGLCSVCKGKGKVFETVHIKENPTNSTYSPPSPTHTSRPTSSSADDGDGVACLGLILIVIVLIIVYYVLIITGYVIVYSLILTPILMVAWMLITGWQLKPKWLKLIWPLTFFVIPWVLLNWRAGAMLNNLDREYFSLGTFESATLTILRDIYSVLGVVAVAISSWDVIIPFVKTGNRRKALIYSTVPLFIIVVGAWVYVASSFPSWDSHWQQRWIAAWIRDNPNAFTVEMIQNNVSRDSEICKYGYCRFAAYNVTNNSSSGVRGVNSDSCEEPSRGLKSPGETWLIYCIDKSEPSYYSILVEVPSWLSINPPGWKRVAEFCLRPDTVESCD